MGIRFIIDSAADILPDEAKSLGMLHLPLTVRFGEREFADAVDLTHRQFYEKLIESDTLPTTAQITPTAFEEAYRQVIADGDTAIVFTLSSKLSGTYQSACIAADEYPDRVFVVDSESVSLGERILIERAVQLRDEGRSAEEIVEAVNEEKHHIRLIALVDTLEYLKKGGRVSAAVAFAGGLLSIKPVLAVVDGAVEVIGKARGSKQGNNLLRELVKDSGGINFDKPFCLAYSGLSDDLLQKYIEDSAELWQGQTDTLPIATVGCAIGTHAGPGAVALAFFEKEL